MIYLDHNATTPVLEEVIEAMLPWLRQGFGNPSSDHPVGRAARAAIDAAREEVGSLIGAPGSTIVFTGGGTESSNLAIRGLCAAVDSRRHIVTSAVEHPATTRPCARMERSGWRTKGGGIKRESSKEQSMMPVRFRFAAARSARDPGRPLRSILDTFLILGLESWTCVSSPPRCSRESRKNPRGTRAKVARKSRESRASPGN